MKQNSNIKRFGLQGRHRLKTPADFQRVYKSKQWGSSALHTFNVLASKDNIQLGVTVSKKVSKRAVDRNRIKRQVKEFFRMRKHQLEGAELVITAKPKCNTASDQERSKSLEMLWEKLLKWQRWHQKNSADSV